MLDADVKAEMEPTLEKDWHARFSDKKHDDMSVTPAYLLEDAELKSGKHITSAKDQSDFKLLEEEGVSFKKKYLADAQRMFCRVQHHMHKRTKRGMMPLKACMRKGKKTA